MLIVELCTDMRSVESMNSMVEACNDSRASTTKCVANDSCTSESAKWTALRSGWIESTLHGSVKGETLHIKNRTLMLIRYQPSFCASFKVLVLLKTTSCHAVTYLPFQWRPLQADLPTTGMTGNH